MPLALLAALLPGEIRLRGNSSSLLLQWEERIISEDYCWNLVVNFPENPLLALRRMVAASTSQEAFGGQGFWPPVARWPKPPALGTPHQQRRGRTPTAVEAKTSPMQAMLETLKKKP